MQESDKATITGRLFAQRTPRGRNLSMPDSRPMPSIAPRVHELRIDDPEARVTWRIIYRIDRDAIVIGEVFSKKTQKTPQSVIDICKRRFKSYDLVARG